MDFGAIDGGLEVRKAKDGSRTIAGRFPYNSLAVMSDGGRRGRPRKERFASHAFHHSVESKTQEITLLFGHDFSQPLASKLTGSLALTDAADALSFVGTIAPEVAETSFARDVFALIGAGLAVGLSPGFRVPPERTVPNAESVSEEDPAQGDALIRTIYQAILFELSIVTRPAYSDASVEERNWQIPSNPKPIMWGYR